MKNIVIAEFKHETNCFSPILADEKAYRSRNFVFGEDVLGWCRGVKNEIGGFVDVFAGKEGFHLIPAIAANAMPGGLVSKAVYEIATETILSAIRSAERVDGVLLALHGAMVPEGGEDGEGPLLAAIRAEVGPNVPIIASLDLHANVTALMCQNADAFFGYDHFPHTDMYETGVVAAQAMYDTLCGKIHPVMRWRKLPYLFPLMPTASPVMKDIMELEMAQRERPGVLRVNLCHGFFHADIEELGAAVIAVADGDAELAQRLADELGELVWSQRRALARKYYTVDEAIDEVLADPNGPIVLADVADNPGAGGSCDTTYLLRRLIERKVPNVAFAILCDPQAVEEAEKAGVGKRVKLSLGGKIRPEICGEPLEVEAYVKSISDGVYVNRDAMCRGVVNHLHKTAVLVVDDIEIIVASNRVQPWDLEVFRSQGIMPQDKTVLVAKSTAHFRASYGTVARKILDVSAPALAPQDPRALPYKNCRRPIYPLDDM